MNAFSNWFVTVRVAGDNRFALHEGYWSKGFDQIVTIVYLRKQPPEVFCKKEALRNFPNFTKNASESLFLIHL